MERVCRSCSSMRRRIEVEAGTGSLKQSIGCNHGRFLEYKVEGDGHSSKKRTDFTRI